MLQLFIILGIAVEICMAQIPKVDSLKLLLRNSTLSDTARVEIMNNISFETRNSNYDTSIHYASRARDLSEQIGFTKGAAFALRQIGNAMSNQGLYKQALDTTLKALRLIRLVKDEKTEALILNNIGFMLKSTEQYKQALEYFKLALQIFTKLENKPGMALVLGNIGDVYFLQRNFEKSLEYEFNALRFARESNASTYTIGVTLFHIGTIYTKVSQYDSARYYQEQALELFKKENVTKYIAKSLNNLAQITFEQRDYKRAIQYGQIGLDVARSISLFEEAAKISQTLSNSWKSLGDYKKAHAYLQTYTEWRDSLTTLNLQQKLEQFKSSEEIAEKKKQILLLEKEKENQQIVRNSLVGGIVLTLLFLVLAINRYYSKQRSELLLKGKQAILEYQAAEIQLANTELQESLETLRRTQTQLAQSEKMASLGTLVAGVAHELNTPIGVAVTAASTLHSRTHDFAKRYTEGGLKKSELETYIQTAQTGADLTLRNLERASNLIQSFKQVAVDQTNESKRRINLDKYLHEIITSLQPKLKTTNHRVIIECDERIELETYPGAIAQIITNLVTNSLLHGFQGFREDGAITITAKRNDPMTNDQLTLTYSDNGRGIPPEVLPRIFDPFFTTKQAQGGTGLGMHIVYNLVTQKLGGDIQCESEENMGVTFCIRLSFLK